MVWMVFHSVHALYQFITQSQAAALTNEKEKSVRFIHAVDHTRLIEICCIFFFITFTYEDKGKFVVNE